MEVIETKDKPVITEQVIVEEKDPITPEENKGKTQEGLIKKQVAAILATQDESTKQELLNQFPKLKDEILEKVSDLVKDESTKGNDKVSELELRIKELEQEKLENEKAKLEQVANEGIEKAKTYLSAFIADNGYDQGQFAERYGKGINEAVNAKVELGYSYEDATILAVSTVVPAHTDIGLETKQDEGTNTIELTPLVKAFLKGQE